MTRPSSSPPSRRLCLLGPGDWAIPALAVLALVPAGCTGATSEHPWLELGDDPPHRIVEVGGNTHGQLVIVVDPGLSREAVLALGHRIEEQAPPGVTVNARIFNDEQTARSWRTAPAEWTLRHLLAVVTVAPETGRSEVRWMVPEFPDGETAPPTGPEAGPSPAGSTPTGSMPTGSMQDGASADGPTPPGSLPDGATADGPAPAGSPAGDPGP